jgi:hypothetical protein
MTEFANNDERMTTIQGLRDMADWLENTPEALLGEPRWNGIYVSFYGAEKEHVVALAGAPGGIGKNYYGASFELIKKFGPVTYSMGATREAVCTKKVVGTKTVEKEDPEVRKERLKDIPIIEVEEEVIEWECHPLLVQEA